jgi:hypothetical protein
MHLKDGEETRGGRRRWVGLWSLHLGVLC